jgi:hypothetical protein
MTHQEVDHRALCGDGSRILGRHLGALGVGWEGVVEKKFVVDQHDSRRLSKLLNNPHLLRYYDSTARMGPSLPPRCKRGPPLHPPNARSMPRSSTHGAPSRPIAFFMSTMAAVKMLERDRFRLTRVLRVDGLVVWFVGCGGGHGLG